MLSSTGMTAVGGPPSGAGGTHTVMPTYATSLGNPIQANITKIQQQAPTTQSYVVSTGSLNANTCGADSGDETIPVSIHVTNNIQNAGGPVDQGPASDGHGGGQSEVRFELSTANYLISH